MKRIIILLSITSIITACETNREDIQLVKIVPGECALEDYNSKKSVFLQNDTLMYTLSGEKLDIKVGFNATCCTDYQTSSIITSDTIFININSEHPGLCDCICFYTYNFIFEGLSDSYAYKVNIDNYLVFSGIIEP